MHEPSIPVNDGQSNGILADLPRRRFLDVSVGDASLSQMRFVSFKANHLRSFSRLFSWFRILVNFYINIAVDILWRRDSPKRRAQRLRRAFERKGGSFVKL